MIAQERQGVKGNVVTSLAYIGEYSHHMTNFFVSFDSPLLRGRVSVEATSSAKERQEEEIAVLKPRTLRHGL